MQGNSKVQRRHVVTSVVYCRLSDVEMCNVVSRIELVKRSLGALPVRQVVENADFSEVH